MEENRLLHLRLFISSVLYIGTRVTSASCMIMCVCDVYVWAGELAACCTLPLVVTCVLKKKMLIRWYKSRCLSLARFKCYLPAGMGTIYSRRSCLVNSGNGLSTKPTSRLANRHRPGAQIASGNAFRSARVAGY